MRFQHYCGGTLLNELHVLTAAHCLFSYAKGPMWPKKVQIMAGDLSISLINPGQNRVYHKTALVFIHPRFNITSYHNDVAMMRLVLPVLAVPGVITFSKINQHFAEADTECELAGWGYMDEDIHDASDFQMKIRIKVIPDSFCSQAYSLIFKSEFMFCAGDILGGPDACAGDSGGGLLCEQTPGGAKLVFGVVSFGIGCGRPFFPSTYTNLTTYKDWIDYCISFSGQQSDIPMPPYYKKKRKHQVSRTARNHMDGLLIVAVILLL